MQRCGRGRVVPLQERFEVGVGADDEMAEMGRNNRCVIWAC